MAEMLLLEFNAPGEDAAALYRKVSSVLGVDPSSGKGDWPAGMLTHIAGVSGGDTLVVAETWESKEAQEKAMTEQLLPAFGQVGAPQPSRVQWLTLEGQKR